MRSENRELQNFLNQLAEKYTAPVAPATDKHGRINASEDAVRLTLNPRDPRQHISRDNVAVDMNGFVHSVPSLLSISRCIERSYSGKKDEFSEMEPLYQPSAADIREKGRFR